MLNFIWLILILYIFYFGLKLNKYIKYKNYNLLYLIKSFNKSKKGLFLTLGTKIGVGSIVGTTMAIFIGGPGSVFWMIIFSLFTSSIIYYESVLGNRYKKKLNDSYVGGSYFYLKYGLGQNLTAIICTALLIACYSFFFQMIQTNTVSSIIKLNLNINILFIAFGFLLLLLIIIFFSIKELLNTLNKIVPFICLFFIISTIWIIFKNHLIIPQIINLILKEAFSFKGILVGSLIGIKRSIFLNEILIGTTSIASSIDDVSEEVSASAQVLGSYFITFIISIFTSFLVLIFKLTNNSSYYSYNDLINKVFSFHYGNLGGIILIILVSLLAISTLISGFYIGLSNLEYITKNKYIIFLFKIFMVIFSISGIFINENRIWNIIDYAMMLLIIINIISISFIYRREIYDRK